MLHPPEDTTWPAPHLCPPHPHRSRTRQAKLAFLCPGQPNHGVLVSVVSEELSLWWPKQRRGFLPPHTGQSQQVPVGHGRQGLLCSPWASLQGMRGTSLG